MKKLVLIDSNALVHRAFHALPPLSSPQGVMTNAVFGFTSVLFKMFKELKPDYVIATFDLAGKTFRHEEFAEYKVHRVKAPDELYQQIPLIKSVVRAAGIPIYEREGFEADDLIGSLAKKIKKEKNVQVVIVTGDLDTLQLVDDDKVIVFTLKKGITDTVTYDEKAVMERYGLKPEQVVDFKGLKGDPSDNIPGVPGVGDKTASALIGEFGNMEKLYIAIEKSNFVKDKIKTKKTSVSEKLRDKLIEFKDQAFFSRKLATIHCDMELDFNLKDADWKANIDKSALEKLLKDFGFSSLIKRLSEVNPPAGGSAGGPAGEPGGEKQNQVQASLELDHKPEAEKSVILKSHSEIARAIEELSKSNFTFDIEEGVFSFTNDGKSSASFDLGGLKELKGGGELWDKLKSIFEDEKIGKTGHGLKELIKKLLERGVDFKGVEFDTKIAFYLLNPDFRDYALSRLYYGEFNEDINADPAFRPVAVHRLRERFEQRIIKNSLTKVLYDIELPLAKVLAQMEIAGVRIDLKSLARLSVLVNKEIIKLEKSIFKQAGTDFNINSPQQLSEILFNKLNLTTKVKKTSTGAKSTAASELDKLAGEHPIIDSILRYRELQKLKTTYIEPFPNLIDKKTARLHTTFNQAGAATGRLSSQDPNLQNIPIKTEIGREFRKCFVASPGYKLVSFDYSQLELRIAAHISGDPKMTEAFKRGDDIHTITAAEIFEVRPEAVTPAMRRQAKVLNFGILYGMGISGFQRASGVSRDRAREFIDRYFADFKGVASYMQDMKTKARKDGYVETIFGRKRYLPEIKSGMPQLISQAERVAINMPIQGTESDILKKAMIEIQKMLHENYDSEDIKMILTVHDELLFEVKNNLVDKTYKNIKKLMEDGTKLSVPLIVEAKYGDNWKDMELM